MDLPSAVGTESVKKKKKYSCFLFMLAVAMLWFLAVKYTMGIYEH